MNSWSKAYEAERRMRRLAKQQAAWRTRSARLRQANAANSNASTSENRAESAMDLGHPDTATSVGWEPAEFEGESIGPIGDTDVVLGTRQPQKSLVPIRNFVYVRQDAFTGEIRARGEYGDWAFRVGGAGTAVWVCHWNVFTGLLKLDEGLAISEHFPMIRDSTSPAPELIPLSDFAAALAVYRKEHEKRLHIYFAKTEYKIPLAPTLYVLAGRETSQAQPIPSFRKMCAQFLRPCQGGGILLVYQSESLYLADEVFIQHYNDKFSPQGPLLKMELSPGRTLADMCVVGRRICIASTPKVVAKGSLCVLM